MSIVEKLKGALFDNGLKRSDGQYEKYAVLPQAERDKGFVRPYRDTYRHVGEKPKYPLRDLTEEEKERYAAYNYVKFEPYPDGVTGRFWTQDRLDKKACGQTTHMGYELSATYARDPSYYGATFCCTCGVHLPVAEFVWDGTDEVVGS